MATTTKDYNPNVVSVQHSKYWPDTPYLSYDPIERFKKAARELTAGLDTSDLKSWVKLGIDNYGPVFDEFRVEVSVRDNVGQWRPVGDILFARNFKGPNDCLYETRELADHPKHKGATILYIFGVFKTPRAALRDLLIKGNKSHNHRRARETISSAIED